jgi:hypothetical protein
MHQALHPKKKPDELHTSQSGMLGKKNAASGRPAPTFTDAGSLRGPLLWWYIIEYLPESTDERTLGCQYYSSSLINKQTSTSNTTYHQQQNRLNRFAPSSG